MRRTRTRALQKRWRAALLPGACALLSLAGCTGEGIYPTSGLPAAEHGSQPAYPKFTPAGPSEADERLLTTAEREALETQLNKLGSDREAGVRRRIEKAK